MPEQRGRANFEQLYAAVSEQLARGRYRPGDRIGLKALAEGLGVSVTPLREALSRLVGRNVVVEHRSEGYYLTRLDARDIADLYHLHGVCMRRVIELLGHNDLPALPDEPWMAFDALARASADRILASTRAFIDDRLRLLRHCERLLLDDHPAVVGDLSRLLQTGHLAKAQDWVATFHHRRIAEAATLADMVNRGSR